MKDAFGGSFILRIMLIFFVVFICFMTVAINFAKTFRIKNNVINILERSRYSSFEEAEASIDTYLKKIYYSYPKDRYPNVEKNCKSQGGNLTDYGVCIVTNQSSKNFYYKVTAYIVMDFPLFDVGFVIPITGETKLLSK